MLCYDWYIKVCQPEALISQYLVCPLGKLAFIFLLVGSEEV